MILSNISIIEAIEKGRLVIEPEPELDPLKEPFNTSSLDLRLDDELTIPKSLPIAYDLQRGSIWDIYNEENFEKRKLTEADPYLIEPNKFVLGKTYEKVGLTTIEGYPPLAARVEGRSGFARIGLLIHFTAPTIHARFHGPIVLELCNLGPNPLKLWPKAPICQIIIEEVYGVPVNSPSKFRGQVGPGGRSRPSQHSR